MKCICLGVWFELKYPICLRSQEMCLSGYAWKSYGLSRQLFLSAWFLYQSSQNFLYGTSGLQEIEKWSCQAFLGQGRKLIQCWFYYILLIKIKSKANPECEGGNRQDLCRCHTGMTYKNGGHRRELYITWCPGVFSFSYVMPVPGYTF